MIQTIKTINDFKRIANRTHDNTKKAHENWAKCWGLGWWFDLWEYKEYTFNNLKYRCGYVNLRHHRSFITKFYINDCEVIKKDFFNALAQIQIEYKPIEIKKSTNKDSTENIIQLTLF